MDSLDVAPLLAPVAADDACGRDLESTLELYALEAAAKEPEGSGLKGVTIADARNWPQITQQALGLLAQSKDVRVVAQLARALLETRGVAGYASAVALARGVLERYWEHAYPALEDEGRDADVRLNALRELWNIHIVSRLRASIVLRSRELGALSLNDVLVGMGSPAGRPNGAAPAGPHVKSALAHAEAQQLAALVTNVRQVCDDIRWMDAYVAERIGAYAPLKAGALIAPQGEHPTGLFDGLLQVLEQVLPAPSPPVAAPLPDEALISRGIHTVEPSTMSPAAAHTLQVLGRAQTRADVLVLLEQVCEYYARVEPSSPVPLLIQRAKRLAQMSFLDIVRDLADKGLPQVELLAGTDVTQ
ncbi:MAG TPA: type VI secretion system protein TssA [Polyangiales bacterium]|nr:type VI secretion system protein TssA [Polyangiales bacterium]